MRAKKKKNTQEKSKCLPQKAGLLGKHVFISLPYLLKLSDLEKELQKSVSSLFNINNKFPQETKQGDEGFTGM